MSGSGGGANAVRAATVNLVAALYSQMGSQLLDQANSKTNITPKMVALLEEMLDAPWELTKDLVSICLFIGSFTGGANRGTGRMDLEGRGHQFSWDFQTWIDMFSHDGYKASCL